MHELMSYKDIFKLLPGPYIVCAPNSDLTVLAATNSAIDSIGIRREMFINKPLFYSIPEEILKEKLTEIIDNKIEDSVVELLYYSVRIILHLSPVGEIQHIIQRWVIKV